MNRKNQIITLLFSLLLFQFSCAPELEELPGNGLSSQVRISNFNITETANGAMASFSFSDPYGRDVWEYGVCYSGSSSLPDISDSKKIIGSTNNAISNATANLTLPGGNYKARAYCRISDNVIYSGVQSFSSGGGDIGFDLLYVDNFFSSSTTWYTGSGFDDDSYFYQSYVAGDYYYITSESPTFRYFWTSDDEDFNGFNKFNDFSIEVSAIIDIDEPDDGYIASFGLCLGTYETGNLPINLRVSADGSYSVYDSDAGTFWTGGWISNAAVNATGFNKMVIERSGNSLKFYINNVLLHTENNVYSIPDNFSFCVFGGEIRVDYIRLYQ